MSCFGGLMQEYSRVSLDRFDGRNLHSTVYFLSHLHKDHAVGLDKPLFVNRLKSNKDIFLYCSEVTKVLIEASSNYCQLSPYVKCLDINSPTTITVPDVLYEKDEQITVTLLPAFHCPGSVMVLIEGNEGTVLYTGDFRWEHFDIEQMHQLRTAGSVKKIKSLYVDTTFCCPDNLHIPSRQQCIDAVCQIVQEWTSQSPQHVVYIQPRAYYGHEPLINSVASRLNRKVHVNKHKYDIYERIHEFDGQFTYDGSSTQLHACDRQCMVDKDGERVACRYAHGEDKVLYILPTTMYFTQYQQLSLEKIVKRIQSNFYRACYSFHSSYTEVKDLLAYLKPEKAYANVKCPRDSALSETQHRLNQMLKECVECGAGKGTADMMEVRELGTLKIKPAYRTREKRKERASRTDSEDLDFGSPLKKSLSESLEQEPSYGGIKRGRSRGTSRGRGRRKLKQESESQSTVGRRKSLRLSATSSSLDAVTPKKRKLSERSVTDLFDSPEKSGGLDDDVDEQSSFLGSQQSECEMSLFSSPRSHGVTSPCFGLANWSGGSFLAVISSSEDSDQMFCVTEDNEELDESSVDIDAEEEEEFKADSYNQDGKEGLVEIEDGNDVPGNADEDINMTAECISNLIEYVDDHLQQDLNVEKASETAADQREDFHLHQNVSTVAEEQASADNSPEYNVGSRNEVTAVVQIDHMCLQSSSEIVNSDSPIDNVDTLGSNQGNDESPDAVVILDSDSSHPVVMDIRDKCSCETDAIIKATYNKMDKSDEVMSEPKLSNDFVEDKLDKSKNIGKDDFDKNMDKYGENNAGTSQETSFVKEIVESKNGKNVDKDLEKNDKHDVDDNDDVIEIVDLTGDTEMEHELQQASEMRKKPIKISLLSKNMIVNQTKKSDELKAETEKLDTNDGSENKSDEARLVSLQEESSSGKAVVETCDDEIEEISSSPEWLSVSKATASTNKKKGKSEKKSDAGVTVIVSKKEQEERAEVKRQAMGFVCETDSESDTDESSGKDSPTPDVLYDEYIELSSGSDNDDKDNGLSDAGSGDHRNNKGWSNSSTGGRRNDSRDGSKSPSLGWLHSQKRRQRSDHSRGSEDRDGSESDNSGRGNDLEDGNTCAQTKQIPVAVFKRRENSRKKNNYRSNQVTTSVSDTWRSSFPSLANVQSLAPMFCPPPLLVTQPSPYPYPPYNYAGNYPPVTGQHHPSVPSVFYHNSVSLPQMGHRTSSTDSSNSTQLHSRTAPKKTHSSELYDPFEQTRPSKYASRSNDVASVASTNSYTHSNFFNAIQQQVSKAPAKLDMASLKASISSITGLIVATPQSSATERTEPGESLDEMVEKLRKIEQMKVLLDVVSGKKPEMPSLATSHSLNATTPKQDLYDYPGRSASQPHDRNDVYDRRLGFPDSPGMDYNRDRSRYERDCARRRSWEDEDYERWLEERRQGDYYRGIRRPRSPPRHPHDAPYYDRLNPPPPPFHGRIRPRTPPYYDDRFGRLPLLPYHRDPYCEKPVSPNYKDPYYGRPVSRHYRDGYHELHGPPPPPSPEEFENYRDSYYERHGPLPPPPPGNFGMPPPLYSHHERGPPIQLPSVLDNPVPLSHSSHPQEGFVGPGTYSSMSSVDAVTKQSQGQSRTSLLPTPNASGKLKNKGTNFRQAPEMHEFKKKPIISRVLSRSGQVLSVGTVGAPFHQVPAKAKTGRSPAVNAVPTDVAEAVFKTGIIPQNIVTDTEIKSEEPDVEPK